MDDPDERPCSSLLWFCNSDGVVAVHGEVDITTCELFRSIVDTVVGHTNGSSPRRQAHLDLEGVEFISVAGARVLVTAATGQGHSVELVVHHPPPILERILHLGWGPVAGLSFDQSRGTSTAPAHDVTALINTRAARRSGSRAGQPNTTARQVTTAAQNSLRQTRDGSV